MRLQATRGNGFAETLSHNEISVEPKNLTHADISMVKGNPEELMNQSVFARTRRIFQEGRRRL
jgi:hypothetical protein